MRTLSKAVEPSLRSNLTNIIVVNLADDDYEQAVLIIIIIIIIIMIMSRRCSVFQ